MASRIDAMAAGTSAEYSIPKVIFASSVGTMIEWYDFYIFGSLAAVLSLKFYPPGNDTFAYIAYLATFAVGFLVRPFGALFFGRIGDRVGRKYAFLVTLLIMGGATALIGLLPTYKTAGWLAPITLILIRVLQGLALGGEYGGAAVYVAEHVPDNKRGFYTSFIQITATLGLFVSLIVILLTQQSMSKDDFSAWGWRIPFLASIILVSISLYIRLKMKESPIFTQIKSAGMTSAAFYYHFSSREQLLEEVIEGFCAHWVAIIEAMLDEAEDLEAIGQVPMSLLEDIDRRVATSAALALGRMGKIEARPILKGLLRDAPAEDVIEAASSIVDEECAVLLGRIARSGSVLANAALVSLENADHARAFTIAAAIRRSRLAS